MADEAKEDELAFLQHSSNYFPSHARERRHVPSWIVLLLASILAVVDVASLCFGLWMLLIVYSEQGRHEPWGLVAVAAFSIVAVPAMILFLVATIMFTVQAKRLARACRATLLLSIIIGVVAEIAAVVWAAARH
jgi:hypothetical protein